VFFLGGGGVGGLRNKSLIENSNNVHVVVKRATLTQMPRSVEPRSKGQSTLS
jgi:hypothetical protein